MAQSKPISAEKTDAITLLKADHRAVEALFESYEKARAGGRKAELAKTICLELLIHTAIEEEVFYPAVRGKVDSDSLDEAHVEHDGAKVLLAELLAGSPSDAFYDAKVKVLSEDIKHHVKEEEQPGGLFAQVKKADIDLDALGAELAARKAELKATYEKSGPPTPTTRAMSGARTKVGHPVETRT